MVKSLVHSLTDVRAQPILPIIIPCTEFCSEPLVGQTLDTCLQRPQRNLQVPLLSLLSGVCPGREVARGCQFSHLALTSSEPAHLRRPPAVGVLVGVGTAFLACCPPVNRDPGYRAGPCCSFPLSRPILDLPKGCFFLPLVSSVNCPQPCTV